MIENIKSPEDLLAEHKEAALDKCDADCKAHIYSAISPQTQANVSLGIIEQSLSEVIKQEISGALAENTGLISDIELLQSIDDIDAYMAQISRVELTGGRPV